MEFTSSVDDKASTINSTTSSPPSTPTSSVGVLDFNQYTESSMRSPSLPKLPVFHFHSYGNSGDYRSQSPPPPTPPRRAEFPEGLFYIKSALNGNVLDVKGGSRKPDARTILWPQKFGDDRDNQLWFAVDNFIINVCSRLSLDIRGSLVPDDLEQLAETRIIQYTRKSRVDAHNQRFGLSPEGYIYCLAHPNLVFEVRGESDRDGATLIISPRKRTDNGGAVKHQRWICEPVSSPPENAPVRRNTSSMRRVLTGSSIKDLWS
ncbi:ricin B lectin domain-containing protein [Umbelopsis sp. PMI_123]|nr:ricin B lectin domain-containing protein [Umbelopsis sp. PMI_123]